MDWTTYFILGTSIASTTLVWRNLLLDHPRFDSMIANIPFIGNGLVCGFCFPMWVTFLVTLFINPTSEWGALLPSGFGGYIIGFVFGWLSVGASVLFIRFSIVALMDGSAILSHRHKQSHDDTV